MNPPKLSNLPLDIYVHIILLLSPSDFLSLCAISRSFWQPQSRFIATFWRHAIRTRLPIQFQRFANDLTAGEDLQNFYRNASRGTEPWTWGQDTMGSLGRPTRKDALPRKVQHFDSVGGVVDIRIGDRFTAMLTQDGRIHVCGKFGEDLDPLDVNWWDKKANGSRALRFPDVGPFFDSSCDGIFEMAKFSAGSDHVLALSKGGHLWCWQDSSKSARLIQLAGADGQLLTERLVLDKGTGLVAGQSCNSIKVAGLGVLIWPAAQSRLKAVEPSWIDCHTATQMPIDPDWGSVIDHVLLDDHVVCLTSRGQVMAASIKMNSGTVSISAAFEAYQPPVQRAPGHNMRLYGSKNMFSVACDGTVAILRQDQLGKNLLASQPQRGLAPISSYSNLFPCALQNSGVIQIAFGRDHVHALHNDGTVTSYGSEHNSGGALGFGGINHTRYNCLLYRQKRGIETGGCEGSYMRTDLSREERRICFDRQMVEKMERGLRRALYSGERYLQEVNGGCHRSSDDSAFVIAVSASAWHSSALICRRKPRG